MKNILSNQWEILNQIYEKQEKKCAKGLAYIILKSNLYNLNCNDEQIKKITNIYKMLFDFEEINSIDNIILDEIINPINKDIIGEIYEKHNHSNGTRKPLGQFYSPQNVVDYMVKNLNLDITSLNKKFIDIACGSGIFLIKAAEHLTQISKEGGISELKIINKITSNFFGLDINPASVLITKLNMFNFLILEFNIDSIIKAYPFNFNIYETNSIDVENNLTTNISSEAIKIKNKLPPYDHGFDYILGNPPYLEAKKMPKSTKELCRENFPDVMFGAFDIYIAFIAQCNNLIKKDGIISLILPNKFTVAKYAKKMREHILDNFKIIEITDLSEMDIFRKADVYPIIFTYKNSKPKSEHKTVTRMSINNFKELFSNKKRSSILQSIYKKIGSRTTFFYLPDKVNIDKKLINIFNKGEPISKYLKFRSTVSFHQKGLREKYVKQKFDGNPEVIKKYLGGVSYARKNEVTKYNIKWKEYYINYDQKELKSIKNPLPPLSIFERKKIIFCQHSKEINATYDPLGEWVTKDVFPIAFSKPSLDKSNYSLKYFTGLLNSDLYSFIYGIIYKGIQISDGYYHYLPTWMKVLPIIKPEKDIIQKIENIVDNALQTNDKDLINRYNSKINKLVYKAYNINEKQIEFIKKFNR
ncbi:MAG: Eco57I restriction-modification methylase domain-containing protein [archaeon]